MISNASSNQFVRIVPANLSEVDPDSRKVSQEKSSSSQSGAGSAVGTVNANVTQNQTLTGDNVIAGNLVEASVVNALSSSNLNAGSNDNVNNSTTNNLSNLTVLSTDDNDTSMDLTLTHINAEGKVSKSRTMVSDSLFGGSGSVVVEEEPV